MKRNLVKTPCGLPIGEAVSTKDGEPGLEIMHKGKSEIISLKYLMEQVKKIVNRNNANSRNTERGA